MTIDDAHDDPWLDAVLRAPHVDDDGFTARVTSAVPDSARGGHRGIVGVFGLIALIVGLGVGVEVLPQLGPVFTLGLKQQLVALVAAAGAMVAAALSGESLRLQSNLLRLAGGSGPHLGDLLGSGSDDDDRAVAASAAAVPTLNVGLKRPHVMINATADLDEETAMEVVLAARKHRGLFGTVWFFCLAAPFILIALDGTGLNDSLVGDIVVSAIMGGFVVGTPIVWWASRRAFFKECEQLGIARPLARRLRFRLSMANLRFSPEGERDRRAVRRLLQRD